MKFRRSSSSAAESLAAVPWFGDLGAEQLAHAARHADWVPAPAGTRLQRQGFQAGWLWVAVDGPLEVRRNGNPVGVVRPGGAWGEAEVLLGIPSAVEVVAPDDLTVVSLPAAAFHGMLGDAAFATTVARRQARASLRPSGLDVMPA
jgi:CRP-like cAMP-binding protein